MKALLFGFQYGCISELLTFGHYHRKRPDSPTWELLEWMIYVTTKATVDHHSNALLAASNDTPTIRYAG